MAILETLGAGARKLVRIQIAEVGSFKGHPSGPFELTPRVFSEIVTNFRKDSLPIPIDAEHASEAPATSGDIPVVGAPAMGWIHDLEDKGAGGLWGLVEWLEPARTYIKEGRYRYLSPAVRFNSRDRVTGQPIGARLSSAAITNTPWLRTMAPLVAARDIMATIQLSAMGGIESAAPTVTMTYAHTSNEYMPRIRACLRMPDLASARECADAMDRLCGAHAEGGGAMHQGIDVPSYMTALRDMMQAPLGSTVEEIFEAVKAMIAAAIEEHEATEHGGDDDESGAEMSDTTPNHSGVGAGAASAIADAAAAAKDTTMSDSKVKELEVANGVLLSEKTVFSTANAELSLKLKDAETRASKLDGDVKTLLAWKTEREAADLKAEVDTAFETYKDVKRLSDADRANMLVVCKAAPEAFRALYPKVDAGKRHLLRDLAGKDPTASAAGAGAGDKPADKPLTIVTLADKLRTENPKLTLNDSLLLADKQIRSARGSVSRSH